MSFKGLNRPTNPFIIGLLDHLYYYQGLIRAINVLNRPIKGLNTALRDLIVLLSPKIGLGPTKGA